MDSETIPNKTVERVIHGVRQDIPNPEHVEWLEVQLQRKQAQLDRAMEYVGVLSKDVDDPSECPNPADRACHMYKEGHVVTEEDCKRCWDKYIMEGE
jgi:hypothetical protein